MKLLWILALAIVACKVLTGRWPWEWTTQSGSARAEARARTLLGVRRNADRAEVIEAHRRLVAQVHPDKGGTGEQVHEANAARDLLLESIGARQETR
ncbi:MAG: J domain-containing protein [Novosphingobium sp.]